MTRADVTVFRQEMMIKKLKAEVTPDKFTSGYLSRPLWKYKKIRLSRAANKLWTMGDVIRCLHDYVNEVCATIDEMEAAIDVELNGKDAEIYFPEQAQKLVVATDDEGNRVMSIEEMATNTDWRNALNQRNKLIARKNNS